MRSTHSSVRMHTFGRMTRLMKHMTHYFGTSWPNFESAEADWSAIPKGDHFISKRRH
ncbi:uncharacterized protein DS421_5g163450 [Arachis hypogaea]|nr:uncharacterized protein DS421_5g163450 [Arachis hypogaea]